MGDPIAERLREVLARVKAIAPGGASEEEEARRRKLEETPDAELERIARGRAEPVEQRTAALGVFVERNRTEKGAADLLLELLEDPEEAIALEAIRRALPFDMRMVERLRALMDDPREAFWSEATLALAQAEGPGDPAEVDGLVPGGRDGAEAGGDRGAGLGVAPVREAELCSRTRGSRGGGTRRRGSDWRNGCWRWGMSGG